MRTNRQLWNLLCIGAVSITYSFMTGLSYGAELREPITLASENGILDILMIAKASPIYTLPSAPTGWVTKSANVLRTDRMRVHRRTAVPTSTVAPCSVCRKATRCGSTWLTNCLRCSTVSTRTSPATSFWN